jgi:aerobic-type carbon monoxide dehydrogenase small subunit (CoxS/CutS family)
MAKEIEFTLNSHKCTVAIINSDQVLVHFLRDELKLKATKFGCGMDQCGACKVLIDDQVKNSCQILISDLEGKSVVTIEGLQDNEKFSDLKKSFVEENAAQCGFCTSGILISCFSLISKNTHFDEKQIKEKLKDNLCRCGVHQKIIKSVIKVMH